MDLALLRIKFGSSHTERSVFVVTAEIHFQDCTDFVLGSAHLHSHDNNGEV